MASASRESSRDRDGAVVRHQHSHSFSESGRISVPMWDSSDPDRAPPPLPLNPGSPKPTTRPNTSAAIAERAKILEEKARESAPASSYTTNAMPDKSPERSLIKGAAHRRMQSLNPNATRDLRSFLDNGGARSPERSPDRSTRAGTPMSREEDGSPERGSRAGTPTPAPRDGLEKTPSLRPTSRSTHKAILGENTPPSATMLALQAYQTRESPRDADVPAPLSNITNSATIRTPQSFDAISTQISSLTTIATNLQREMTNLSRRSKDNATDLVSLKEATSARDEDIRKSLRELVTKVTSTPALENGTARNPFGNLPSFATPPNNGKSFSLPRIPSPSSFLDDRSGAASPYSVEGAASVAMLEKIIREMVTKEGQDRLLSTLNQLFDKASKESGTTAKKVEQLVEFIKDTSGSQALVPRTANGKNSGAPQLDITFDPASGPLVTSTRDIKPSMGGPSLGTSHAKSKDAEFVGDEIVALLKQVKDSVTTSHGFINMIKTNQGELRREVLTIGRELGKKIDEAHKPATDARQITDGKSKSNEDVVQIVHQGLADLKQHMEDVMREKRRQSNSSMVSRTSIDSRDVQDVVKHALAKRGLDQTQPAQLQVPGLDKESILDAVKEAYEAYKPEIELQQFGLERDEILQCLKEGLEDYRAAQPTHEPGVSKEEVMDAIHDAMQQFPPPAPVNEGREIREEVMSAVRDCLDEMNLPSSRNVDVDVQRGIMVDAVKEGLSTHGPGAPKEIEISRDDLFDAVQAGLENSGNPFGKYGEQVVNQLHELVNDMRSEFKSYSAANGRDTEQVLDAMKDGLESLRAEVETYVDRAQDVTGKDEIIDTIRSGLNNLRNDVEGFVAEVPHDDSALSKAEMLAYIKSEFEHLHATMSSQVIPRDNDSEENKQAILTALHAGFESLRNRSLGDDGSDELQAIMKEELEQMLEKVLSSTNAQKAEVLDILETISYKLGGGVDGQTSNDEVISTMKGEFEHLRETLAGTLVRSGGSDPTEIVESLKETLDGLRTDLSADQNETSKEMLGNIQGELEHLRGALSSMVVPSGNTANSEEILDTIRSGLDDIRSQARSNDGPSEDGVEALRTQLAELSQSLAASLARTSSRADTEEVLETVRLGLDDLRSHIEKKLDSPDKQMSMTGEILDALNDGLETLKTDVAKMVDKPVDMTVSYEILDTLKGGLASLRADIDQLKEAAPSGNEVVLAENAENADGAEGALSREVVDADAANALKRDDIEKMEVALAQLQIKIEAMDAYIQNPPPQEPAAPTEPAPGTALKTDVEGIEGLIKELQVSVALIAAKELSETAATKEDTDAIETLLRNTKAQLDDAKFPDPDSAATKEHIESLEAIIRATQEGLATLCNTFDEKAATKADVAVVEVLSQDIKAVLEEVKESAKPAELDPDIVKKPDLDVLGVLCSEIKEKVSEMKLPDPEAMPSKADMEQLTGLIHDFRESHDKLKDSYETDIAVTAKAFDDRKKEAEETTGAIADVKAFLEEVKEDIKTKVGEGNSNVGTLTDIVKSLDETIGNNFNVTADIKELLETVNREFERANGAIEGLKTDNEEKSAAGIEKQEENRAAVIAEVSTKLEERFDTIMSKYDDAQAAADEQKKSMEEKIEEQKELLSGSKAMADDLKLTIDTLGTAVTGLESTFAEVTGKFNDVSDKMSTESQTVFGRIDETFTKIDEHHSEAKGDHQLTRDEVAKAITAIDALQTEVTEYHPTFMVTLREVLALVNQHYEHSQKAQENLVESVVESAKAASEESKSHVEELKSTFSGLPALLPPPPLPPIEVKEEYDDTKVHEKLDQLINHAVDPTTSEKLDQLINHAVDPTTSTQQIERLDKIHQQVMATAAEVSDFVTTQTRLITEGHESREKEAEEAALLLERRIAQREQVEDEIRHLDDEKLALRAVVDMLKDERDALAQEKNRLGRDVASLHTALDIRREELHAMDTKADKLERRILDGLMDHSRVLLQQRAAASQRKAAKKSKPSDGSATSSPTKTRSTPRRVSSNASESGFSSLSAAPPGIGNGLNMALNSKTRAQAGRPGYNPNTARRILSLNQISSNVPSGIASFGAGSINPPLTLGNAGLKRSHSVKNQSSVRKPSWNGQITKMKEVSEHEDGDKENALTLARGLEGEDDNSIFEADESQVSGHDEDDETSDAGTERRRVSFATQSSASRPTTSGTDAGSALTYGTGSEYTTETDSRRGSYSTITGESELTAGTGSYLTGSELTESSRRTSGGSTVRSVLEGEEAAEVEDGEEDATPVPEPEAEPAEPAEPEDATAGAEQAEPEADVEEHKDTKDIHVFTRHSDSGLGSEIPTAGGLSGSETDYFRRAAEEATSALSGTSGGSE
ncbi:hypothetical protein K402DRAFT_455103 [Aulographum hederae CBS 113979]|uniref:Chromosome segregation ATPase family protein n=1 Tax=Aulographum hederae CBS 113979 TaxID=1176131 RepID=A0A6G1GWX4_9PEZI|nr:hypothetical protein K402DRAFT_455103 [Aulographum hederae CBS 113979]